MREIEKLRNSHAEHLTPEFLINFPCRFDKDVGAWKERGLGDISVLWNKKEGKGRVLMRREQILKLCCNHNITPEMEMKPHQGKGYMNSRLLEKITFCFVYYYKLYLLRFFVNTSRIE